MNGHETALVLGPNPNFDEVEFEYKYFPAATVRRFAWWRDGLIQHTERGQRLTELFSPPCLPKGTEPCQRRRRLLDR